MSALLLEDGTFCSNYVHFPFTFNIFVSVYREIHTINILSFLSRLIEDEKEIVTNATALKLLLTKMDWPFHLCLQALAVTKLSLWISVQFQMIGKMITPGQRQELLVKNHIRSCKILMAK